MLEPKWIINTTEWVAPFARPIARYGHALSSYSKVLTRAGVACTSTCIASGNSSTAFATSAYPLNNDLAAELKQRK